MAYPTPTITPINEPYWVGLTSGELRYQECIECHHRWLPPREACPACLSASTRWRPSIGHAKLISWVVYHTAYHPAFEGRLPYVVACVELMEGPRMLANLVAETDVTALRIDQSLSLRIEDDGGLALPRFFCD